MRTRLYLAASIVTLGLHGCGGGSSGDSGAGSAVSAFGTVQLLSHSPADGTVQVDVATQVRFEFDAPMALDTFGDEDTWLRKVGSTDNVPGTWSRGTQGRVAFTPSGSLALESDYTMQLSGLTSDDSGRLLDVQHSFTFRTFDATPPQITAIDVVDNSTNQSRERTYTITWNEQIGTSSVTETTLYLRDSFGFRYAAQRTVVGNDVILDPYADLPADRQFFLVATSGLADRAGNQLAATSTTRFRTTIDVTAPRVNTAWPDTGSTDISPLVQPTFTFNESMDPATVEAASLLFQDEFGSIVPFDIESSRDQRTLRVVPNVRLQPNRRYTMAFLLGGAAATDVSGNPLDATQALTFSTGSDDSAPTLATSSPMAGETRVPATVIATLEFDEPLDTRWIDTETVSLTANGVLQTAVVEMTTPTTMQVTPVLDLPLNTVCMLVLRGGHEGHRDLAGNVWTGDITVSFTTSADAGLPRVILLPPEGAAGVAVTANVRFLFDAPMDPSTVTPATTQVLTDAGQPVNGQLTIEPGNRAAKFVPAAAFTALTYYRLRVIGGSSGARRSSGNWFQTDQNARFRTGASGDSTPPNVTISVNRIAPSRSAGLVLPPFGFTVEVAATDPGGQWADMASVELLLTGTGGGTAPEPTTLRTNAVIGFGTFDVTVPATTPLSPGDWTLTARVRDLTGNTSNSAAIGFAIADTDAELLPFERTQVVWVRTDLDRNGNSQPDFDDDMLRLGLATAGDPIGTNTRMRNLVLDGILAQSNHLFGRGARGEPLSGDSVGLRFAKRQPIAIAHMQMALGGLDPEGSNQRTYAQESTGVLGRAYYDYRNSNPNERNISNEPGLGVFPGEMWLYQTRIHDQVWPSFQTVFAQRFRPLCPDMGGVPAGAHALDSIVLAPGFDYATANGSQRARWQTIMDAADDWATVMGIILAHEVGHSVGLVAPGAAPSGLFGEASLHDSFASAAEVMAASVGYEAMTALDYHFRDIDLAYLRQRVLLR